MTGRYRANAPRFVDETVDGEALIMDMVKGTYYSCVGASAVAWNALKVGADRDEVANAVAAAYSVGHDTVLADVGPFLDALLAEEMLVPDDDARTPSEWPAIPTGGGYSTLALERYTDLADLILLDPVHDVSEAGWPNIAE